MTRALELASVATEQTTAGTDALLALTVCGGIVRLRQTTSPGWRRAIWLTALGAFASSAVLGTIVHGAALDLRVRDALWQPLYLLLGVALALFVAGALTDWQGERAGRASLAPLLALAGGFYLATRLGGGDFRIFVLFQTAALLFALSVYGRLAWIERPGAATMVLALLISLAAGAVQAADDLTLHLVWPFDHNGLFHLVQLAGVVLLIRGLRIRLQPAQAPR